VIISAPELVSPKNAASNYKEAMRRNNPTKRSFTPNFYGHPVPAKFRWHLGDSSTKVLFGYPGGPRTLVLYRANLS